MANFPSSSEEDRPVRNPYLKMAHDMLNKQQGQMGLN